MTLVFKDRLTCLVSLLWWHGCLRTDLTVLFHFYKGLGNTSLFVGKTKKSTFLGLGPSKLQKRTIFGPFLWFSQRKRKCSPNLFRGETRPVSQSFNAHDNRDKVWRLLKNRFFSHFLVLTNSTCPVYITILGNTHRAITFIEWSINSEYMTAAIQDK